MHDFPVFLIHYAFIILYSSHSSIHIHCKLFIAFSTSPVFFSFSVFHCNFSHICISLPSHIFSSPLHPYSFNSFSLPPLLYYTSFWQLFHLLYHHPASPSILTHLPPRPCLSCLSSFFSMLLFLPLHFLSFTFSFFSPLKFSSSYRVFITFLPPFRLLLIPCFISLSLASISVFSLPFFLLSCYTPFSSAPFPAPLTLPLISLPFSFLLLILLVLVFCFFPSSPLLFFQFLPIPLSSCLYCCIFPFIFKGFVHCSFPLFFTLFSFTSSSSQSAVFYLYIFFF